MTYGIFPVFEEAGALVFADELDEGRRVRLPILRESFELLEDGVDARRLEQLDRVLRVLVEIRIEDALIHEVLVGPDVEQHPPEVMQLQWGERMRTRVDGLLNPCPVRADFSLGARLDLRDDREAMTRGRSRIGRAVSSLLKGEVALLRNRQGLGFAPVVVGCHRSLLDRATQALDADRSEPSRRGVKLLTLEPSRLSIRKLYAK